MVKGSASEKTNGATKEPTKKRKIGKRSRSDRQAQSSARQLEAAAALEQLFSEIQAVHDTQREINCDFKALREELRAIFAWQKRVLRALCIYLGLDDPEDDAGETSASDQSPVSSEG